jgi:hypothetical protein
MHRIDPSNIDLADTQPIDITYPMAAPLKSAEKASA